MPVPVRPALALGCASAFSALPGAFYHRVAETTGSTWSTVWLFTGHGLAGTLALTVLLARSGRPLAPRALPVLLVADAAAGLLLVLAPAPGGFGLLLAGRLLTGALLGLITTLATGLLLAAPGGSRVAVAMIFGGVGVGSLGAGLLSGAGWSRAAVLGLGVAGLICAATVVLLDPGRPEHLEREAPVSGGETSNRAVALAFVSNGVLALFTSTLPGVVADHGSGSALLAGSTAGIVMLAAGGARLGLTRLPATAGLGVAVIGVFLFGAGLAHGGVPLLLAGGLLLGAAAGIGYDAALNLSSGVIGLHAVQRGGQLGLVLPVLVYPLVVR
ncbi:hypothetical protein [Kineosporia succinea]|uniref:MFS family permease n=1 Tax=Kineosporia succinea TaxID=84632 RepID=A0ABT9PEK5_9ACTN|nr:hypothetical protein [Kineosporia succinea]MDP9830912.1 MFS family permease [Kineosporia succinea]